LSHASGTLLSASISMDKREGILRMSDNAEPQDPLLWATRRERALRWLHTDLKGYPTVRADEETEETLKAAPKEEQIKKRSTEQSTK
jgi:hypothetical protein